MNDVSINVIDYIMTLEELIEKLHQEISELKIKENFYIKVLKFKIEFLEDTIIKLKKENQILKTRS